MKSVTGQARWQVTGMNATCSLRAPSGNWSFISSPQSTFNQKWRLVTAMTQNPMAATILLM